MKVVDEFRKFAMRGSVIDLAVGVVVGAAFTAIVNSLVKDIITPPIARRHRSLQFLHRFAAAGNPRSPEDARMNSRLLIAPLLGIALLGAAASASEGPAAVANGFYGVYATFHPSDGIPDAKARAKYEPFISPALDKLLIDGDAAEAHFAKVTKHMSPPLMEGDIFTSNFEGATTFHVGACTASGNAAHCAVSFTYTGGKKDEKPANWTDTVYLVHTAGGWRVDDIGYGATWAFGNKGRLKDVLASAIRDGNSATP